MSESLECDECGTLNDPDLEACELCGDPLGEERDRRTRRSGFVLTLIAIVATAIVYLPPGYLVEGLVYVFWTFGGSESGTSSYSATVSWSVWGVYTLLWGLAVAWSPGYDRDKQYRFEEMADYDDYLEARDEGLLPPLVYGEHGDGLVGYDFEDRLEHEAIANGLHTAAGCILVPLHAVRGLWASAWARLTT